MKIVDPVVATTQTPTPVLNNEMASYEEVDFYTLDSFHKCFYDVSTCNNGVVLSRKLPPDKVKVKLLATTAYLMTLIMCILIPATSYNGVPAVLRTSSVGVIPEEMSTCDTFHNYTMSSRCHHHFPFKGIVSSMGSKSHFGLLDHQL